jgi:hypothetical protein
MRSVTWLVVLLIPVLALVSACGDDDSDDGDNATSTRTTSSSQRTATRAGGSATADNGDDKSPEPTSGGGGGNANKDLPTLQDGNYENGTVHVEITGDKKQTIDADGNAFVSGGYALISYVNDDNNAAVILAISHDTEDEPGGLSITTKELATAGDWSKGCKISATQNGNDVKGDFSCDDIEYVEIGSVDTGKIDVKGTFTLKK